MNNATQQTKLAACALFHSEPIDLVMSDYPEADVYVASDIRDLLDEAGYSYNEVFHWARGFKR